MRVFLHGSRVQMGFGVHAVHIYTGRQELVRCDCFNQCPPAF